MVSNLHKRVTIEMNQVEQFVKNFSLLTWDVDKSCLLMVNWSIIVLHVFDYALVDETFILSMLLQLILRGFGFPKMVKPPDSDSFKKPRIE